MQVNSANTARTEIRFIRALTMLPLSGFCYQCYAGEGRRGLGSRLNVLEKQLLFEGPAKDLAQRTAAGGVSAESVNQYL